MSGASGLRLLDFNQSTFWAIAGIVSVFIAVPAVARRIKVEEQRIELLEERNAAAAELERVAERHQALQKQLTLVEQHLVTSSDITWAPTRDKIQRVLAQHDKVLLRSHQN